MRFINNRVFRMAAMGFGLALTASLALAGQGTFTLPVEAHIGTITLSPGDYRIITPGSTSTLNVVYLYGNGKLQATLPLIVGTVPDQGRSYLELVNAGGVYFVRKYNAPIAGKEFTFEIPKKYRHGAVTDLRATSLPVSGQGK